MSRDKWRLNVKISEEKYKEILDVMPIACVDIVIVHNGEILMVKRKNHPAKNKWFFSGGRILKNEKLKDAAIRKSKEDTDLNVKITRSLIFGETIFKEASMAGINSGTHTINVVFLVETGDNEVPLDEQGSDYKWVNNVEEKWDSYVKNMIGTSGVFK